MVRLFISHSSNDREIASLLVDVLRSALNLPAEAIRCTSVDGHRLAGGESTDPALRREIRECEGFIGLISKASIESAYVLFELGARWGVERHLLPLLSADADATLLRGPLSGVNALRCSSAADLHQMITELADLLSLPAEKPSGYQRHMDQILSLAARSKLAGSPNEPNVEKSGARSIDEFAGADATISRHCEKDWPDDFNMREHCINEQERALAELRRGCPPDFPAEVFKSIRRKCSLEWPTDFLMRAHCEDEQIKAYRKLQERKRSNS